MQQQRRKQQDFDLASVQNGGVYPCPPCCCHPERVSASSLLSHLLLVQLDILCFKYFATASFSSSSHPLSPHRRHRRCFAAKKTKYISVGSFRFPVLFSCRHRHRSVPVVALRMHMAKCGWKVRRTFSRKLSRKYCLTKCLSIVYRHRYCRTYRFRSDFLMNL